jgi:hypothetical protein
MQLNFRTLCINFTISIWEAVVLFSFPLLVFSSAHVITELVPVWFTSIVIMELLNNYSMTRKCL